MPASPFFIRALVVVVLGFWAAAASAASRVEISHAAQPQLAVGANDRVWLAYGHAGEIFVARSVDGGATFAAPIRVAAVPKLMLGMRRGPRIAVHGDDVTITAIGEELVAFHSGDGGRTWSGPVTVNDVPTSAREGLHDLAVGPDGERFVTWLDLRNGKTELWGAASADAGRTWKANTRIYRSPDVSVCECCHPTALFDGQGNLAVMWRNAIGGARDMWLAVRPRGAEHFTAFNKVGTGTWLLKACPMDGGRIVSLGDGKFGAVWQRNGEVFYSGPGEPEVKFGAGKQPVALVRQGQTWAVWQEGADLAVRRGLAAAPAKLAATARFPVLVARGESGAVVAYETGPAKTPAVVVERW